MGEDTGDNSVARAVRGLRSDILAGRLVPGQRLVARDVTEQKGFGPSTFREALQRLAAEGLVSLVPNRGAEVAWYSRRDVRELFEIRMATEGLAARLAAARCRDGANRAVFRGVFEAIQGEGYRDSVNFVDQNGRFHQTIVEIGDNRQLAALLGNLKSSLIMIQARSARTLSNAECSFEEHRRIGEAILAGDPDAAQAAMVAHLDRARSWYLDLPDEVFRPSSRADDQAA
jgi:DNA-binding GntR family transcriptional regulator